MIYNMNSSPIIEKMLVKADAKWAEEEYHGYQHGYSCRTCDDFLKELFEEAINLAREDERQKIIEHSKTCDCIKELINQSQHTPISNDGELSEKKAMSISSSDKVQYADTIKDEEVKA